MEKKQNLSGSVGLLSKTLIEEDGLIISGESQGGGHIHLYNSTDSY